MEIELFNVCDEWLTPVACACGQVRPPNAREKAQEGGVIVEVHQSKQVIVDGHEPFAYDIAWPMT